MKAFLRNQVPLLTGLGDEDIELLARAAVERRFAEGRHIVHKGDPGESAFILKEGMAETLLEKPAGASIHLSDIGPGELFGELALFDGEPRSASVIASRDTTVIEIRRELFLKEIARHPETSMKLLSAVAKRLRRSETIVSNFAERIYGDVMPRLESTVAAQLEAAKVICRESKDRVDMTAAHAEQLLQSTSATAQSLLDRGGEQAERVLRDIKEKWSSLKVIGALIGTIFAGMVSVAGFFGFESYKDVVEKKREIERINVEAATLVNKIKKESDYLKVIKETRLAFENMRRDLQLDDSANGSRGNLVQQGRKSRDFFLALDKLFEYLSQPGRQNSDILVEALGLVEETISRNYVEIRPDRWDNIIEALVQCVKDPPDHWRQQQRLDYVAVRLHERMSFEYGKGGNYLVERLEGLLQDDRRLLQPAAAARTALILAKLDSTGSQVKNELETLQRSNIPWTRAAAAVANVTLGEAGAWETLRRDLAAPYVPDPEGDEKRTPSPPVAAFAAALMIAERAANPPQQLDQRRRFDFASLNSQLSAQQLASTAGHPWQKASGLGLIQKILYDKITVNPGSWKNRFSWQYACALICSLDCDKAASGGQESWCEACYEKFPKQFNQPHEHAESCTVAGG